MECKNCKNSLRDIDGFCSSCGARIIDERISLRFLFNEFLDKVLSVDNKLLKTFLHLFKKPEVVIDGFINGVRKKYYNPVSYLLVSITLSGIYLYFLKDVAFEAIGASSDPNNPFANEEFMKNIFNFTADYQALFTVANIPVYGFISWLVFFNKKKYNFYEHLIIYLYAASQTAVLSFLIVVPFYFIDKEISGILTLVMSVFTLVYFAYVLVRLFKLTFFQLIIKTIYFTFLSIIILLFIGILMNVVMMMYMGPENYLKQFKPPNTNDSIQKIEKLDNTKVLQKKDTIKKLVLD
tara:strand:+ start:55076 stop:55957 length:882 start_codon:yes stop_codon:yes gene_type:complete